MKFEVHMKWVTYWICTNDRRVISQTKIKLIKNTLTQPPVIFPTSLLNSSTLVVCRGCSTVSSSSVHPLITVSLECHVICLYIPAGVNWMLISCLCSEHCADVEWKKIIALIIKYNNQSLMHNLCIGNTPAENVS